MVILEEDHAKLVPILERLCEAANAKLVFLVDKTGQHLASTSDLDGVDPTALASLAAGNVAATEGLAKLIGEPEFSSQYHEGQTGSIYVSLVSDRVILLIVFDEHSSLGLVRLRAQQQTQELETIVAGITGRSREQATAAVPSSAFSEISDEDIDALFG